MVAPPGGLLRTAPAQLSPGPPNGDLALGLAGWTVQGAQPPQLLGRGARLVDNTTLVSPPFTVPAGAQTLMVRARSGASAALLDVRARPVEGGPDIPLGTLEPGPAARALAVGVAAAAGRTVSIVLDPIPALGATLDVLRVGPVTAPLPGWPVAAGAVEVAGPRGGRAVRATDPLTLSSPPFAPGPAARSLLVSVRGDGVVVARAGGRRVSARATAAWRDLVVPVRAPEGAATLTLDVRPGAAPVQLRDLGLVRRATRASGVRVRRPGGRTLLRATLGPAGGRLAAELLDRRGRRVAGGRSDAAGRLRLRARARGRLTLVVAGDRTRVGLRRRV
ncbi:MAG TPA: hypothetical protein VM844_11020 [Miltoncostaeaceae bacterium]|nr:hypothetical protein [Miltoncostaeaceae bacterium]